MLSNPCLLFADDTKIYSHTKMIRKVADAFNISKCKTLHIGGTNPNHVYSMAGCSIEQTVEERDLGILIVISY